MVDLHLHTTASDGTLTPEELIKEGSFRGLSVLAITDHDTLDGISKAQKIAKELNITLVPGIEFSTEWEESEIHILGYFTELKSVKLHDTITNLRKKREERNIKIIEKLNKSGLKITYKEVCEGHENSVIGRTHIATILLKKGYVYSRNEAFTQYLGFKKAAYVGKVNFTPIDAINVIHEANGVAIIAHPGLVNLSEVKLKKLFMGLIENGIDGFECYHPSHSVEQSNYFKKLVLNLISWLLVGLIFTG